MKNLLLSCCLLCSLVAAQEQTHSDADFKQIVDIERRWAEQVVTNDVTTLEQILAVDYQGVEPDGRNVTKKEAIAEAKAGPSEFASNHLNDGMRVRVYGNCAIAQGSETFVRKNGKRGRYIWTDTFIKSDGKWRIEASQDLELPGEK